MGEDEQEGTRASFGRVVESVDAVIRRHPAGRALRDAEAGAETAEAPRPLPDNVVDLRARRFAVKAGAVPDDAA